MRSAAPPNSRSGNAARKSIMKFFTSSRPRRGACREYCSRISGAASSSTTLGFQGLPQNSVNQRPTMALLSCSFDMGVPLVVVSDATLGSCRLVLLSACCFELRGATMLAVTTDSLPSASGVDRINDALRRSGAIGPARVCGVTIMSSLKKLRSETLRLRLDYGDQAADIPSSVILKMGHLDSAGRSSYANRREIAFYRDVALTGAAGLVPRCFEVMEATDTSRWHLLLED